MSRRDSSTDALGDTVAGLILVTILVLVLLVLTVLWITLTELWRIYRARGGFEPQTTSSQTARVLWVALVGFAVLVLGAALVAGSAAVIFAAWAFLGLVVVVIWAD